MSSKSFQPGFVFAGRYTIRDAVADGGMARIYRAWDDVTKRDVAIKRLYPYFVGNDIVRKRFISEGKIQQILEHPNIVSVFDIVEQPMLAIIMEFVEGQTLDEYLESRGSLSEGEVLDLIIPILSAVGFAHKRGIIHRDIKPSNILISKSPGARNLKIMDFGVAKIKGKGTSLTATGTTVGTLHYMSPEQIVGSKNIDGRADIYSLGVTLYKLVTGEVPFNAPTEFALMMAQVEAAPLPPSKLNPKMSSDLEKIILKAMAKKANDRFQTIREFTHALLESNFSSTTDNNNETITDRVSLEVLQFAMDADQVGQDMTGEMGLLSTEFPASIEVDTQERTQKIRHGGGAIEETSELSAAELLSVSTNDMLEIEEIEETIEYQKLDPSIADTVALQARVNLKSRARIVFDHSESQDLTAPKISSELYNQAIREPDQNEGPTFENPNFREENPGFFPKSTSRLGSLKESKSDFSSGSVSRKESQSFPKARPTAPPAQDNSQFGELKPRSSSGVNSFPSNPNAAKESGLNVASNSYASQPNPNPTPGNFGSNSYASQPKANPTPGNFGSNSYAPQPKANPTPGNFGSNSYAPQPKPNPAPGNFASSSYPQKDGSGFNRHGADNSLPPNPAGLRTDQGMPDPKLVPTIPPSSKKDVVKKEGFDIKIVFGIAAAFGIALIALTFLILSILF